MSVPAMSILMNQHRLFYKVLAGKLPQYFPVKEVSVLVGRVEEVMEHVQNLAEFTNHSNLSGTITRKSYYGHASTNQVFVSVLSDGEQAQGMMIVVQPENDDYFYDFMPRLTQVEHHLMQDWILEAGYPMLRRLIGVKAPISEQLAQEGQNEA